MGYPDVTHVLTGGLGDPCAGRALGDRGSEPSWVCSCHGIPLTRSSQAVTLPHPSLGVPGTATAAPPASPPLL